ncbi:hypothetical protein Sru01_61460 [Sphaerisporangium rufum]|uniref:Uncharacterized protein n=1 Tax=Sphaerisporangium rufum TaxID=1381558 RepID=A0A919V2X5_9ACTN|nr:hypothetical protein [Sphaerisporangium rufum]GII81164.1 hypothetical protein Sru01_61460 [Sphaerisporangium rufum]
MRYSRPQLVAALAALTSVLAMGAVPAGADTPASGFPPAGSQDYVYSKVDFEKARQAARARDELARLTGNADEKAPERARAINDHVREAQAHGDHVKAANVEYVDIDRGFALILPRDVQVEKVKFTRQVRYRGEGAAKEWQSEFSATVESQEPRLTATPLTPETPVGETAVAASPTWGAGAPLFAATFTAIINGQGRLTGNVEKYKLQNDGNSTYDFFDYYRWGTATPTDPQHYVAGFYLRNYPDAATQSKISYHKYSPYSGYNEYCGEINASLSWYASIGGTFYAACQSYNPQISGNGDYALVMGHNGTDSLTRGIEFNNGIRVPQGFNPNTRNSMSLVMKNYWGNSWQCVADNTSRTCYP